MDEIKLTDLSQNDLIGSPVWRHWTVNYTEYVQPANEKELSYYNGDSYIVLTAFVLHNGLKLLGFCSPQDPSGLDYIQPVIFTEGGQIKFWDDAGWTPEAKKEVFEKLKLRHELVFPISYTTSVKCDGHYFNGVIEDFNQGR